MQPRYLSTPEQGVLLGRLPQAMQGWSEIILKRDGPGDRTSGIGPVQLDKISRLERGDSCGNLRALGADGRPVVGWQNKNCKLPSDDLLLVLEVPVRRDQHVELPLGFPKQSTILQFAPAQLLGRANRVARQELA